MSEENQETQVEQEVNTPETQGETQEETQQSLPEIVEDTSKEIPASTNDVGLSKPEVVESEDSDNFGEEINTLVARALAGDLSDEDRTLLDKAGIGQHFDMIVSGHKAQQEANDQQIYDVRKLVAENRLRVVPVLSV